MCVAKGNLAGRILGDSYGKVDPLMAEAERFDKKNVAPMFQAPKIPGAPPPPQEMKSPDLMYAKRQNRAAYNSTVLAGGLPAGNMNFGSTLLGG